MIKKIKRLLIKWFAREEINLLKQRLENASLQIKELEKDIEMKNFILSLNERSRNDHIEVVNSLKSQLSITHERLLQLIYKTKSDNEIDFAVVSVHSVEVREQYDVMDSIIYIENGVLKKIYVTTRCGVGQEVFEKKSVEELKGLDQREQIYYD